MPKQPSNEYDMRLRGHHLKMLSAAACSESIDRKAYFENMEKQYRDHPEIVDKIRRISEKISSDSNLKIKMVLELDDVCLPTCPEMKESCKDKKDDLHYLKIYGLKPDHVYSSSELLKILNQ
jgi:hypothetical protein